MGFAQVNPWTILKKLKSSNFDCLGHPIFQNVPGFLKEEEGFNLSNFEIIILLKERESFIMYF